ncbi:SDR family oxidoreductase [Aureitalea marina]|uniref:NAD(P)-dependent oxidoreductase n=1 Tax=Aureitalea marina TaxID=930804 RepID=A0A2S7KSI9_9FLAO|nr:SDR family oxidoreductase [Aureitalea marina]PQB05594.1 NAD(P)-dependent oxidoreductase [Aureitalea marina]
MTRTIGMAGVGWLGLPLARHLKLLGYTIKGSVSSLDKAGLLQQSGLEVYPITLTDHGIQGPVQAFLGEVETLVIMIPPGLRRNTGSDYVLKMAYFLDEIKLSKAQKVILVSSTSVYGDSQGKVTEKDLPKPETEAGRQLLQVEQMFFNSGGFKTTIVRFGGLYGGSRQPVRYLAGRKNLSGGNAPVNLIHREDCVQIISLIIRQNAYGKIFNAVMPSHPTKADYYSMVAESLGLEPPHYSEESGGDLIYKQVDSDQIGPVLEYDFIHHL